jgi:serine/threonine-protein kinase
MMGETDAGTLIANRYRLRERTAADSGGEIWDAADLTVGRPVTLRLLRRARSEQTRRFLAAARLAARLQHPGIMQVYDYGQAGVERTPFRVTESAGETTLASVMSTVPLESAWVLDLLRQAASALDAAHAEGLVHDHISPGGLLLVPGGAVKLSDFGLSRAAAPPAGMDPVYLAPERMRGDPATPASDLYALGVVAWECLAGNSARREPGRESRPLPGLPAIVGPGVAALVADLTAIDPADRPASAARVADRASGLQTLPLRPAEASVSLFPGQPGPGRLAPRAESLRETRSGSTRFTAQAGHAWR